MNDMYHWLKVIHIVAVISWMCGMLYLPRLFVYHSRVPVGSEASELFKVMEQKLMRLIINPAMIVVWIAGLALAVKVNAFDPQNGLWMHYKLMLVMVMQIVHAMMSRFRKAFLRDERKARGLSILFTSHKMDEVADICDRVIFLHQGKISSL